MKQLLFAIILLVSISTVLALDLPPGLQAAQQYNQQFASQTSNNISFLIAFLAGIIGILAPCSYPLIPAFLSVTFKEKKRITLMTFIFFLGVSLTFILLGFLAGVFGNTIVGFQKEGYLFGISFPTIMIGVGILLILLGILALFGKGFSGLIQLGKPKNDLIGIFVFGIMFALGWSACTGPIVAGILLVGTALHNPIYSAFLMFFYALGIFVPILILALLYDKLNLAKSSFIKGFEVSLGHIKLHSTNIISAILLIASGIFLIIFRGTYPINGFDILKTDRFFYEIQNGLVGSSGLFGVSIFYNVLGILLLGTLLFIAYKTIKSTF